MTAVDATEQQEARAVLGGRIDVLFNLGRHYLSLPFSALCMSATLFASSRPTAYIFIPLIFQIAVVIAAEQLLTAYRHRAGSANPEFWARRYTFISGVAGATWGVGAWFWFVPHSFAAEAYLTLAFLGMTATEFIARSAHRPAYLAHALFSLAPLVVLLLLQGDLYATMSAILVVLFVSVLASYSDSMARLLNESVRLRNANEDLVVRLQQEKEVAERARDVAEESAQAKATFLANISHELRTPLNALLGMAQILDRAELGEPHQDHVRVMLDAGRGLKTMLDDVITLTHDETQPVDEGCDPALAARAVARLAQPQALEKHIALNVSAIGDLPLVAADSRRVRQVLLKLVDNALKFTESGTVDVRVERVTASSLPCIRFTVSDTGQGIAEDVAPRLFKPFSPGDPSYTRNKQGAGLGLAVAKRIVDLLGGEIGFESEPGTGSDFWFTLPVSRRVRADADGSTREFEVTPVAGARFLIFAPEAQTQLANMLEPFGNRLTIARDIQEALTAATNQSFDAIILWARDTNTVAAVAGVTSPILSLVPRSERRAPAGAHQILAWPAQASSLHAALRSLEERVADREEADAGEPKAALDATAMAALEKSVGLKTLIEILQAYVQTAEGLCRSLNQACEREDWDEAARAAQDIAGSAGALGLAAVTATARGFASAARAGESAELLRERVRSLVEEHQHVRRALSNIYPDIAA
jgi:signal transduction histidine kinase/HPt (histidine-containing phosphotransfer) domain-containing protein